MTLTIGALDTIRTEILTRSDGSETGGILLGHARDEVTTVLIAGGPGPSAVHEPTRFLRGLIHAQDLANEAWRQHEAQWIGEWHTHPNGSPYPSEADLASYRRHLGDVELGFTRFLCLIVALAKDNPAALVAWIVTSEHTIAATIDVENDGAS